MTELLKAGLIEVINAWGVRCSWFYLTTHPMSQPHFHSKSVKRDVATSTQKSMTLLNTTRLAPWRSFPPFILRHTSYISSTHSTRKTDISAFSSV